MGEKRQFGADLAGTAYGAIAADNIVTHSDFYADLVDTSETLAQSIEAESPVLAAGARAVPLVAVSAPVVVGALGTGALTRRGMETADELYDNVDEYRQTAQNAAVRGIDGTGDTLAGYWDEDTTVGERGRAHLGTAWDDVKDQLTAADDTADTGEDAEFNRWKTGGAAAGFGAGGGATYLFAHNYPDLYEPIAEYTEPLAQAGDAIAPEVGAAARTIPFATVLLVGAAGSARVGKGIGAGTEQLYEAVRDRDGVDIDTGLDRETVEGYVEAGEAYAAWLADASQETYDTAVTSGRNGLQWTWDELQDGKEFAVTSAPYQKTVNSAAFDYFVRTPAGVAKRVGQSCGSFARDYVNMKREHWGDKKQLLSNYISPPYGSGLRDEQDDDGVN